MKYGLTVQAALGALALVAASSSFASAAFECPAQPLEAARAATIAAALPTGDAFADPAALDAAVDSLRKEGVGMPLIVDNLIAAYCPIAEQFGLSDAETAAKVNQFAARITHAVYQLDSAEAVILDIPFPPTVVDAINAKAKTAGVSSADWVRGVVEEALD
mgnify:FL=1|jgi:hypothetical protein